MNIKGVYKKFKGRLFPTRDQRIVRKWHADNGEFELRLNHYDLTHDSVVLDFGGYKGQWASDIFGMYHAEIHIFEPVVSFAKRIENRFKSNDKLNVYPIALGAENREEKIFLSEDGSSLYGKSGSFEPMIIKDAFEWITQKGLEKIDLVKINIEGGEYELLPRLIESNLIESITDLQIQFHNLDSSSKPKMNDIQEALKKTHELTYEYEFVWENWRRKK